MHVLAKHNTSDHVCFYLFKVAITIKNYKVELLLIITIRITNKHPLPLEN